MHLFLVPTLTHGNPHRVNSSQKLMIIKFSYHYINPPKKSTLCLFHTQIALRKKPLVRSTGSATFGLQFGYSCRCLSSACPISESSVDSLGNLPVADIFQIVGDVVHHLLGKVLEFRSLHFDLLLNNQSLKNQSDLELK